MIVIGSCCSTSCELHIRQIGIRISNYAMMNLCVFVCDSTSECRMLCMLIEMVVLKSRGSAVILDLHDCPFHQPTFMSTLSPHPSALNFDIIAVL